ncbi:triacylglycerol lipase [Bacterioplanoides sp. SCSIO 12839]|uniref:esterase/lipase family protein n=1 Tax=Bacterioplanoides sp. SCSIO 12839 TaxID=2829569 RepID=UPI002103D97C|nr:triacylglycerol lipase [Bacterioplanoides sp. SCSIO 12839]UTW48335.1 triacylglycerol lipase [Bacterioplanoides sp. SCSIO 12839]
MKKLSSNLLAAGLLTAGSLLAINAQAMSTQPEPSGYTQTKHPVMLVQGILAFDSIAGVDYWYKISEKLESEGATVYTAAINAFNNSVDRGEQLIKQLENIRATDPSIEKFNLVAHSQGGLTSRYVMSVRPDLVASVTTMGSPHTGAPIADVLDGVFPEDTLQGAAFETIGDAAGTLIDKLSGDDVAPGDTRSLTTEFTTAGAAAFNAQFPLGLPTEACGEGPASVTVNGHDIRLYSWGGGDTFTNAADPLDYLFGTAGLLFGGESSDGITGSCASHFGTVIRDDYKMNHGDLINQVLGLHSLFSTDPLTLYRTHANRLKEAGL